MTQVMVKEIDGKKKKVISPAFNGTMEAINVNKMLSYSESEENL